MRVTRACRVPAIPYPIHDNPLTQMMKIVYVNQSSPWKGEVRIKIILILQLCFALWGGKTYCSGMGTLSFRWLRTTSKSPESFIRNTHSKSDWLLSEQKSVPLFSHQHIVTSLFTLITKLRKKIGRGGIDEHDFLWQISRALVKG